MSDLATAVIARLASVEPFRLVAGARELGRSLVTPPVDKMPAAFVLPFAERYGPNALMNGVRQTGPEQVTIVVMVAVKPAIGADVHNPLAAPRAALFGRLLGWQPDPADTEVIAVSGELVDAEATHLTYQFVFQRDHTEGA